MPRRSNKQHWVDLTEILTERGIESLKAGEDIGLPQVLTFDYEGSRSNLKIVRLDRRRGKVWAREIELYKDDEFEVVDKEAA